MELVGINFMQVDAIWEEVKPRIEKVLKHSSDEVTLDDVYDEIKNRDAQLWTTTENNSIGITRIVVKPGSKECVLWMFQADEFTEDYWHLLAQIKEWARSKGCKRIRVYVRPGFEKILTRNGWKKRHVALDQEL